MSSSLHKTFEDAAASIRDKETFIKYILPLPDLRKLDMYVLYKQGSEGDCNTTRPGYFDMRARAKWDGWNAKKGMSKQAAQEAYIKLIEELTGQSFQQQENNSTQEETTQSQQADTSQEKQQQQQKAQPAVINPQETQPIDSKTSEEQKSNKKNAPKVTLENLDGKVKKSGQDQEVEPEKRQLVKSKSIKLRRQSTLKMVEKKEKQQMLKKMEEWINNKLVPRLPESWRETIVYGANRSIHYVIEFNQMGQAKKVTYSLALFCIGSTGFSICIFGLMGTFFVFCMATSGIIMAYAGMLHVKDNGLICHMPGGLQKLLLETSIFDILNAVLIQKRMSKLVIAVVGPFINAQTTEEAKAGIAQSYREGKISHGVYKAIYKTGILNNMDKKTIQFVAPKKALLARKERIDKEKQEDKKQSLTKMKTLSGKLMAVMDPQKERIKLMGKKVKRSLSEDSCQLELEPKTTKESEEKVNDGIEEVKPLLKEKNTSLKDIVLQTDDVLIDKMQTLKKSLRPELEVNKKDPETMSARQTHNLSMEMKKTAQVRQQQHFKQGKIPRNKSIRSNSSMQSLLSQNNMPLLEKKSDKSGYISEDSDDLQSSMFMTDELDSVLSDDVSIPKVTRGKGSTAALTAQPNNPLAAGFEAAKAKASSGFSFAQLLELSKNPKELIQKVLRGNFNGFFRHSLSYQKLMAAFTVLAGVYAVQLRYSNGVWQKTKNWFKSMVLGLTFFCFIALTSMIAIKYKIEKAIIAKKRQSQAPEKALAHNYKEDFGDL